MKKIINSFLILLIPISLFGQIKPIPDQYVLNPLIINPAYAGSSGVLSIAAFYRQQWIGITGAPETLTLAADAPLPVANIGLGLIVRSDKIGVTKETSFNSNYAYRLNLKKGILSFGLGAGLIATNTAWSELVAIDPGDEQYLIDSKIFIIPDFSFGVYYTYNNYFAGFSIPKLLTYNFQSDKNKYSFKAEPEKYNYLFNTGYLFNIGAKTEFFPSILTSFSPGEKLLYDLNAHFIFLNKFWIGASYRNSRSLVGFFQLQLNDQFRLAYTYNYAFGKLSNYSHGSHEIMLRYEFRYKVNVVNPLVF